MIDKIIDHDADVFCDGVLIARFRKGVLPKNKIDTFYENVRKHANNSSKNRAIASGDEIHSLSTNTAVKSNIFGYYDIWGPYHKNKFKKMGIKMPLEVRETGFTKNSPDEYEKTIPLIQDIDHLYKKLVPDKYKKQYSKARETHFRIPHTSFTTVTTNINFQTALHYDKGDDDEGFGNLTVIERGGKYTGAETCFPEYGIGFDVREGDILFMNVHHLHGNLPMKGADDAVRLSIVCYLRKNVWKRTRGKSKAFFERHTRKMRKLF